MYSATVGGEMKFIDCGSSRVEPFSFCPSATLFAIHRNSIITCGLYVYFPGTCLGGQWSQDVRAVIGRGSWAIRSDDCHP